MGQESESGVWIEDDNKKPIENYFSQRIPQVVSEAFRIIVEN
jgi:hypothetical protein